VQGKIKAVHFVSTYAASFLSLPPGSGIVKETSPLPSSRQMNAEKSAFVSGYIQSKWVCEKMMLEAAQRGVPVTIHRVGRVLSSLRTGATNPDDLMTRFIVGCVQLERLPLFTGGGFEYGAPVDAVAAAIVALGIDSQQRSSFGQTFHIFDTEPTSYLGVIVALGIDYGLRTVEGEAWLHALAENPRNVAYPLLHELNMLAEPTLRSPVFDSSATAAALAKLGRQLGPTLDYAHACKQLDFLRRRRMLPPARAEGSVGWLFRSFGDTFSADRDAPRALPPPLDSESSSAASDEVPCLCMACDDDGCDFQPVDMFRRPVGERDVCIKVLFCGVCHSDLTTAASHLPVPSMYPMVPGHEAAGVVTRVGSHVSKFRVGDHVGVGTLVDSCLQCHSCLHGQENWCSKHVQTYNGKDWSGRAATGGGVQHTLGGYSTSMVVHEHFCILVPPEYPLEHAGPVMCAGTTMYAPLKAAGAGAGTRLGLVGLGGLGVMGIKLGKALGCHVTVISRGEAKRKLAVRAGADSYLPSSDAEAMAAHAGCLDLILNTIPTNHDPSTFNALLAPAGWHVHIGLHAAAVTAGASHLLLSEQSRERFTYVGGVATTQEVMDLCAREDIRTEIDIKSVADLNRIFELLDSANESGKRFVLDIAGTLVDTAATAPATRLQPGPAPGGMLQEVAEVLAEKLHRVKAGLASEEEVDLLENGGSLDDCAG